MVVKLPKGAATPPLSQSRYQDMGCSLMYHSIHVRKMRIESEASRRGSDVHAVVARYMDHLNITRQKTDYKKLQELSEDSGEEAREILGTFLETWFCDPEKIYDTELYIALDEDFNVIEFHGQANREDPRPEGAAYEATLDLVIMDTDVDATIDDWKTFHQIVDAESFQSKLYPLMLFCLNPKLKTVTFILNFVRYGDATRSVSYTREDVPKLKKIAERERRRQVDLETKSVGQLKATPGSHCIWCPILMTECPMKQINPFSNLTPEERVGFAIWMKSANKENNAHLKYFAAEKGPIPYRDANGVLYEAGFVKGEKVTFPLIGSVPILTKYLNGNPGDKKFVQNLNISGLATPLKAKKRGDLAGDMESVKETTTVTKFKIGQPGEREDDDD